MLSSVVAGRDAFRRRAWREAYDLLAEADAEDGLAIEDLERRAIAAHLLGADEYANLWARAHAECVRAGDVARAARCAFWLAYGLLDHGEVARGNGWLGRAAKLIDGLDCVEQGYLLVPQGIACFAEDPAAALERFAAATGIGERFGDAGLSALGRMSQGQALIALDRWAEAIPVLDAAMVAVSTDDIPPVVAGNVFCGAIDACRGVFDVVRTREWTIALTRWCDAQPDLVPFRGECLVHRAEAMQLRGEWPDAADEADRACDLLTGRRGHGEALYRAGELRRLRGHFAEAEQAYRAASQAGREPLPGLALLRLAQGETGAATGAIRRILAEASGAAARATILAPYVEIMLASGETGAASTGAQELNAIAAEMGTPYLRAMAAGAEGAVLLSSGEPRAALAPLRRAWTTWRSLEVPYEAARVRVLIGLACRALDDQDGAEMELDAARLGFQNLGAATDQARVDALLAPRRSASSGLTSRELEVVALVAKGRTNREIAAALVISEHTVARHVQNIFAKLGLTSRTAVGSYAYEHRLL